MTNIYIVILFIIAITLSNNVFGQKKAGDSLAMESDYFSNNYWLEMDINNKGGLSAVRILGDSIMFRSCIGLYLDSFQILMKGDSLYYYGKNRPGFDNEYKFLRKLNRDLVSTIIPGSPVQRGFLRIDKKTVSNNAIYKDILTDIHDTVTISNEQNSRIILVKTKPPDTTHWAFFYCKDDICDIVSHHEFPRKCSGCSFGEQLERRIVLESFNEYVYQTSLNQEEVINLFFQILFIDIDGAKLFKSKLQFKRISESKNYVESVKIRINKKGRKKNIYYVHYFGGILQLEFEFVNNSNMVSKVSICYL